MIISLKYFENILKDIKNIFQEFKNNKFFVFIELVLYLYIISIQENLNESKLKDLIWKN